MDRLTHERCNGMKAGYWSAAKKVELVQRLGTYEDTGLEPEEIMDGRMLTGWIPVEEQLPEDGKTVLASDEKYVYLVEYEADDVGFGDVDGILAWMPLPEPYMEE